MNKEELRDGLKRLGAHLEQYEIESLFVEEGEETPLDALVLGLVISEELSLDVSCNFVDMPEYGSILQFYGQLELDGMMEENPGTLTESNILQMINQLNKMLPAGQFLYLQQDENTRNIIGLRYTMRTDLASESELEQCADIVNVLMDDYELLCSVLVLILDGETVQDTIEIIMKLMAESQ